MHVVWSSQLGAKEKHVAGGAELMVDPRAFHYWDPERTVGTAFQQHLGLESPAWDVWMLFAPGVVWEGDLPPEPTWWEHQLSHLERTHPELRLDPARFAEKAVELSGQPVE